MAELRGRRAQLRKTIADFWVLIGNRRAQQVTATAYAFALNSSVGLRGVLLQCAPVRVASCL